MADDKKQPSWHYDPTINLGHIVTTAALLITLIVWGVRLEGRVDQGEQKVAFLDRMIEQQRSDQNAAFLNISDTLIRIENKLDGKADKP